jgi:magnesium chelatase subunit I
MHVYPFSAIVGQTELTLALQLAVVEPSLGGVLIFGDRGTGKSTAVRALAQLLPPMPVVVGCPYRCAPKADGASCAHVADPRPPTDGRGVVPVPVVDLPLGSTEDRVVGSLDLEAALARGERRFSPGLLAQANRGFLYIDEVNLLPDHLVDLLLDVAASGENVVEREGISVRHPARFVLIGSGNPEEGELRPQLLDRFGLSLDLRTPTDVATRVEIVKRRLAFERDPAAFAARWEPAQRDLAHRLMVARSAVASVEPDDALLESAAKVCLALGTDGLRAELTLIRAACARAALDDRSAATLDDLAVVAPLALRHRMRRAVLDEVGSTVRVERAVAEVLLAPAAARAAAEVAS